MNSLFLIKWNKTCKTTSIFSRSTTTELLNWFTKQVTIKGLLEYYMNYDNKRKSFEGFIPL